MVRIFTKHTNISRFFIISDTVITSNALMFDYSKQSTCIFKHNMVASSLRVFLKPNMVASCLI